jgi:hypothetical protein
VLARPAGPAVDDDRCFCWARLKEETLMVITTVITLCTSFLFTGEEPRKSRMKVLPRQHGELIGINLVRQI